LVPGNEPKLLVKKDGDLFTGPMTVFVLAPDLSWQRWDLDLGTRTFANATSASGQTIVLLSVDEDPERFEIAVLRAGHLYPTAQIESLAKSYGFICMDGEPAVVQPVVEDSGFDVVAFDIETGQAGDPQRYARRVMPRLEDFSLLVLIFALLLATIVMYLFRPAESSKVRIDIPRGMAISEPRRRLFALLIDLLPSALLAGIILQMPLNSIFSISRMPMMANQWHQAWPAMLVLIITSLHETIGEILTGRSLGKWAVNCTVIGADGQPARIVPIFVRNLMKFVALLVPVLFLFVYLNPYRQHLGDLAGRCIVVTTREDAGNPPPEEADP